MTAMQTAPPRTLDGSRLVIEAAGGDLHRRRTRGGAVPLEVPARGERGRSRSAVEGARNEARARRILDRKLAYVYHESFDAPGAERTILGSPAEVAVAASARTAVPTGLPPYLASLFRDADLLSREQEADLFRRMNYLKHRARGLRDRLDPSRARSSDLDEIERLQDAALALKNRIVQANLRLVVAIAKKRVGPVGDLFELVSDGNMSLMQAVEKFDFARGFKFSTYASWAIIRNFSRSVPAEKERRERFVTGLVDQYDVAARAHDDQEYESDRLREREAMEAMLGRLNDRERQILINRYGLDGADKMTLVQLGHAMGVTKERIRQIEVRARNKLRKLARAARPASSG
jgi:RNA polymerase primary sigma factor